MRFEIERDALNVALNRVTPFAEARSPIPILASVKIAPTSGGLVLSATDMTMALNDTVECPVSEGNAVCVDASRLSAFVKSLLPGSINATLANDRLVLTSRRSRATFPIREAADYPIMGEPKTPIEFDLPAADLGRVIAATMPYISNEQNRYYLAGTHFRSTGSRLYACATDGNRLSLALIEVPAPEEMPQIILPKATCERLRALAQGYSMIHMAIAADKAVFSASSWRLMSKVIDGTFPDYSRVIPPLTKQPALIDSEALSRTVSRIASMVDPDGSRAHGVRLQFEGSGLVALGGGHTPNDPEIRDELDITYDGKPLDIGLQARYLLGAIDTLATDQIELHMEDAGSPFRLCRPGETEESVTLMGYRA